jgi:excisionase family DNA binding protein
MNESRLLTTKEAADWAQVSERTVLRQIAAGELPARRIGARWRIDPAVLERWGMPALPANVTPLSFSPRVVAPSSTNRGGKP